ncbi:MULTISPECIES: D-aminoacylase [unclassified Rhodanobacter]|uniref:N-acyl-D-amino-acid deacylase family protein n=1 Tax=unclassified Rhodanobacter TaxID=2621553 RepID=UPI001BDEF6DE|nr:MULTISPECIES: D-aminoacylase [unclassified Rhodanobacter]MBT2143511.1 D-aminoacylase [Rhodanobacter sp. LX-99]MBT2147415.1 D-aminoacylase [Rhodanobacter sp. LX-100]
MPLFIRTACMWIVAAIGLLTATPSSAAGVKYDTIIRNGHIIDGTGSPWYAADVAVKDGRIAAIGNLADAHARQVIDAHGLVVAPGFIDMLGQSEITLLVDPHVPSKIFQGITTEITGEGESVAPLDAEMIRQRQAAYAHYQVMPDWRTFEQYFTRLQKHGMGINVGTYVGATSVREMVIGYTNRAPTPDELKQMQMLVADAMKQGALGLSTALEYTPAPYAGTDELIALAKVAARHGGIYATHMRNEGDAEMAALDETFRIGREADIPVEIFHLKATGNLKGKMAQVIARIDAARASGIDVAADTYAYTAWQNDLSAFIPPWAHDGGNLKLIERLKNPATRARIRKDMLTPGDAWDNEWLAAIERAHGIMIGSVNNKALQKYVGKRVSEIAAEWHEDPIDTICDFLIKDNAATSSVVFGMRESDVDLALKQSWVSIDTDYEGTSPDGLLGKDRPHPRAYGTFPRILAKYVREQKLLTLPDAIRKFSALAAQREHLTDRGVLKQGMWADIVVFDPDTIRDVATFTDPNQLSVGMQYVLVNGVPVIDGGKMTDALPGAVLRGPAYSGK